MNGAYQQGPLSAQAQPMKATGCNQCWYSPFIGGPHQYVWVGYNPRDDSGSNKYRSSSVIKRCLILAANSLACSVAHACWEEDEEEEV